MLQPVQEVGRRIFPEKVLGRRVGQCLFMFKVCPKPGVHTCLGVRYATSLPHTMQKNYREGYYLVGRRPMKC